ncbi:MAG: Gfo/Idh/MocA family oxidoreductase [Planctomycetota bacterium]
MSERKQGGVDRRRFIKTSAALAATPLLGPAGLSAGVFAGSRETLKVGLIGCGGRGTGAATQALRADPNNVIWALADAFPDRVEGAAGHLSQTADALAAERKTRQFDVPAERRFSGFDAYRQLIDSGVDVVLLATPPYFRPAQLEYAIEKKKHVFCEKPMAVDGPGMRRVMAAARRAKEESLSLVCGFCWRYKENDRRFVAKLREGVIGDIRAVHTTYLANPLRTAPRQAGWSDMEFQMRNWQHFNWLSGDHIVEQAVHSIDKIHWFMNEVPTRCVAVGGRQARPDVPETGDVFDHFAVTYEYANGARAFHAARQMANCPGDNSDYILGSKGIADVNSWGPKHVVKGENKWLGDRQHLNDMYQQEHDELFASIRKGEPINDGDWFAPSVLMAIMARMSAYTGQTIGYEQALNSKEVLGPADLAWGEAPEVSVAIPGVTKFL